MINLSYEWFFKGGASVEKKCKCNPFCNALDSETRQLLCQHVTCTYQKQKQIQSDHWAEQIEIIAEGSLLSFTLLEDGTQKSIEIVQPGDILGTHLFSNNPDFPEYHTLALNDVKKCNFPVHVFENLFQNNRQFAQTLLQNISNHHARNSMHWVKMHSKNGEEKVEYIYELLKSSNVDMNRITQEELALIAGVSRITVARAMKQLFRKK